MNANILTKLDEYRALKSAGPQIDKPVPTSVAQEDFSQVTDPQTSAVPKDRNIFDKSSNRLSEKIDEFIDSPKIVNDTIYALPSDEYELANPISVILKIYKDEVIALFPELELFAEGANEFEAVANLKLEILDLFDDLEEFEDAELGTDLKGWKKTLKLLLKKCQ